MNETAVKYLNDIYNLFNQIIEFLNNIFSKMTNGNSVVVVIILSIILGFYLKKVTKKGIWYWVLFSLLIFMSMRYLGLG